MVYRFIVFTLMLFWTVAYCSDDIIISNYKLPKNNALEVYEKTKDLELLKTLFEQTNDFESIEIKDNKIFLEKKPTLKTLNISGNKSFWKSEIRAITGLNENYTFDTSLLQTIPLRIRQFYADKGFLFTTVDITSNYTPDGYATINLKINEGKKTKLNDIIFLSDQSISELDRITFLKVLKLKKGDYLYFDEIEKKIENLLSFLRKGGYYDAFVNLQDIEQVNENYANLYVAINFGTKYTVNFKGNKAFNENELRKLLTLEENGFNYYQLNKSKENIIEFYKGQGFLDVDVSYEVSESEDLYQGLYSLFSIININIEEGQRYKVDKLEVKTDTPEIMDGVKKILSNYYNQRELKEFLEKREEDFYSKGYLSVNYSIKENVKDNGLVDVEISFYKGKQYILTKINQENYKTKIEVKLPKIYDPKEIVEIQKTLKKSLQEDGFLDGDVLLNVITQEKEDKVEVIADFVYEKGSIYKNGITFIYGSNYLNPKVVKWQLREKDTFDSKVVDVAINRLYDSRLFDYINPVFLKNEEEKVLDKALILHDDKRGLLQGSVGYSTDQQFKVSAALILKNLFSYGLESSIYLERSNFQTNYRLSFGSRLLPYGLTSFISPYKNIQYRRYFNLSSQGFDFFIEKFHNKFVRSRITFESKDSSLDKLTLPSPVKSYSQFKISLSLTDDHRNSKIDPKKGYLFISKISKSFKDIDYYSGELSLRLYSEFFNYLVFSPRFSTGYIFKNNNTLPISERYFLGGISSLRGFGIDEVAGEKGIGGNSFILINNDLRFLVYPKYNIYLLTFYDLGNVYTDFKEYKSHKFRKTAGIGIYVPTPAGSLILDYAKKLDRKPGESGYRIEFSIGLDF
ncbi:outer membrane protein assembly factor [Sulfurihydrogenibium azorense]|uniref:BamA/OMP85 family outer membrane protein n=1 Tax=Sulfurihydrogenibium azorense TaxID=309806 RepID=UPI00240A25FC|nr:BamA/TamA family outer membrane protein [Sulfurihydrogenibium azorense]MDM7273916.1 BamA/TamA family outer membrane protein [Sulfurihydrogenibium azorense]